MYGAIHFSYFAADYLQDKTDWNEKTISLTAFAITFIVIVILVAMAGKVLTKIADFAALGILNKLLGGVFGALKIAFVLSVLLNFFDRMNNTLPFVSEETIEESTLYEPVKGIVPKLFPNLMNRDELEETNEESSTENI